MNAPRWSNYTDEQLLDMRFCDLRLSLKRSNVAPYIARLYDEIAARGLRFRPHVWLAAEWFSPDGVPGFAVPFYLAHPRLARLERKMLREVEGGNANWLMRILRHETGHAIDSAFRLRRRDDWRAVFGKASTPYPRAYRPKPTSDKYVLHLGHWYAQTHPTEDFAETFAVWLKPRSRWRSEYAHWPAQQKLRYVDELMNELRGVRPKVSSTEVVEPLAHDTRTLRSFYQREQARYAIETTQAYDAQLRRVFVGRAPGDRASAAALVRELRPRLVQALTRVGIHPYLAHNVLRMIVDRCRDLDLAARDRSRHHRARVARLLERVVFDTLYRRRQQYVL